MAFSRFRSLLTTSTSRTTNDNPFDQATPGRTCTVVNDRL